MQGVGKTLTAGESCQLLPHHPRTVDIWLIVLESVAEASGKPLLAVSVSDIGLNPTEVEGNLQRHFELAVTWRAVMLL